MISDLRGLETFYKKIDGIYVFDSFFKTVSYLSINLLLISSTTLLWDFFAISLFLLTSVRGEEVGIFNRYMGILNG